MFHKKGLTIRKMAWEWGLGLKAWKTAYNAGPKNYHYGIWIWFGPFDIFYTTDFDNPAE